MEFSASPTEGYPGAFILTRWIVRLAWLTLLMSNAEAQSSLSASTVFSKVIASGAVCGANLCTASTKFPPNALAQVLALLAFNMQQDEYTTAGRGWLFRMTSTYPDWNLSITPLTGPVSNADQLAFPLPQRPEASVAVATESSAVTARARNSAETPPAKPTICSVAIDVRGLNKQFFQSTVTICARYGRPSTVARP